MRRKEGLELYYAPNGYPYHVNEPLYYSPFMSRDGQGIDLLFKGIKEEASTVDFYNRLIKHAPNPHHQQEILQTLEEKYNHLNQLEDVYMSSTGIQPVYEMDRVAFNSYKEGIHEAYNRAVKNYEEYRNHFMHFQHSPIRDLYWKACQDEIEHAGRFRSLYYEIRRKKEDYGGESYVVNIEDATKQNDTFRTAIWTGDHLQVTLMSIGVGEDIGLEVHPDVDQFLRIEEGKGLVQMGDTKNKFNYEKKVKDDYAIMVPAGKWHNLKNTGNKPLKLYSIYAPPEHPFGTVHKTKAEAMEEEGH